MKKIFIIGAGLSSSHLINYLKKESEAKEWKITVGDASIENAKKKCNGHKNCKAISFDINNKELREQEIKNADIIVSLLPPTLHIKVATDCVKYGKHMVTASYVSPAMAALHKKAEKANILLLNEMGLDPGIDHLSAMQMMDQIRKKGGEITSFRSYCGGLVAKKFDTNPWHYKFTWNPKNVVVAGQSTAKFKHNHHVSYVSASRIFSETEVIEKEFDAYLNRDSISYIKPYGLENAKTVVRGTLRIKGFCDAWNVLVQLGITDDTYIVEQSGLTIKEYILSFLPKDCKSLKAYIVDHLKYTKNIDKIYKQLLYLGFESETEKITISDTPANILLSILKDKWKLEKGEHDRIIMIHYVDYKLNGKKQSAKAILDVEGESQQLTAMSKTVGLPMGIAVKLILTNQIKARGVHIPITEEFYTPVLKELKAHGVAFKE